MTETTADHTTVSSTALACVHTWPAMVYASGAIIATVVQSATALGPPRFGELNTPVSSAPRMPPTPCTPNTSSESSAPSSFFRPLTPHRQAKPAMKPMIRPPPMPTLPAAGVMATRPATAPEAAPSIEALPRISASPMHQASTAAAVANSVLMKARAAKPLASSAEPALKPNQPTHSSEAPTMVRVRLCGAMLSLP